MSYQDHPVPGGSTIQRTLILALIVFVLATAMPVTGAPEGQTLQPGTLHDGSCTLSFVLDGQEGAVYMTSAEHCTAEGAPVHVDGMGQIGTTVYTHEPLDIALIELDDEAAQAVQPWVKGHPTMPTGVASPETTAPGDQLLLSGHGVPFHVSATTRENRSALLLEDDDREYRAEAMVSFGDSGGPVLHAGTGQAIGIVSRFSNQLPPANLQGPSLHGALEVLHEAGFQVTLRTA